MRSRLNGARRTSLEPLAIALVDQDVRVDVEAAHLPGPRTLLATAVRVAVLLDVAAPEAQERPAEE
jgi:hypothetical protein